MELRRIAPTEPPKLTDPPKSAGVKSAGIITGYGLKFNVVYEMDNWHYERISPTALMGADMSDVICVMNHDVNLLLGRNTAGTLRLKVDKIGLWYQCTLPDSPTGWNVREAVRRGDLSRCSFVFSLKSDTWERPAGGKPIRVLTAFKKIWDVGPVVYPANPAADVYYTPTGITDEGRKSFEAWQAKQQGKAGKIDPIGERLKTYQNQIVLDDLWALQYV